MRAKQTHSIAAVRLKTMGGSVDAALDEDRFTLAHPLQRLVQPPP